MSSQVPVIGLFSGAGGLEIGATRAGADVRLAVDNDATACETLRRNKKYHSGTVANTDASTLTGNELRELAGLSKKDTCIMIGGPPCQPFSKAAYWTDPGNDSRYRRARTRGERADKPLPITTAKADHRRTLVSEYLRLIKEVAPDGLVFENVPSITHPRNRHILSEFRKGVEDLGYHTQLLKVNAVQFGVAQNRHRIVVLGMLRESPQIPQPTHSDSEYSSLYLLPPVSTRTALEPFADEKYAEREEVVIGRWAEQLHQIPPGKNYKALSAWAGHPKPVFEAETRFWNFLLKLDPELPSWTISANPGPWVGPFHWNSRRLRTCELAALQSFPSDYDFAGNRRERIRQIGNAVPPAMAHRLIEPLVEAIAGAPQIRRRAKVLAR